MKFLRRTKREINENFLENLLIDRGILEDNEDYKNRYFNPTAKELFPPELLDNMKEGKELLEKHIKNNSTILIIMDSDLDGVASSTIIYNYLSMLKANEGYEYTLKYLIPEGKEHGLETKMDLFLKDKIYDLIIIPDAGSNDTEECKILKGLGYDILILDHHLSSGYCQDAVVINNQLSKNYPNKALSGAGVVYKFLKYFESNKEIKFADAFLDLVAVAHVADCMNTNTLENRYINKVGLSNIFNEGLRALIKQQAYSLFRMKTEDITEDFLDNCRLTQAQVAYYIAPLVNALIRVGNQNEKDLLFKAFTETYALEEIPSTKRGHSNETETISEQNARNCANARARQNKEKEKAGELLDIQIIENCLDENQILVLHADDLNVSTTLTGLCATEVVSRYKKPVLLGRTNSEGLFRGSVRGVSNCELTDTKQFLLDSNLMDYAEG